MICHYEYCLMSSYHCSGVLPLGQFVEDPQQVNTGKKIPPAKLIVVSCFLQKTKYIHVVNDLNSAFDVSSPSNTHTQL